MVVTGTSVRRLLGLALAAAAVVGAQGVAEREASAAAPPARAAQGEPVRLKSMQLFIEINATDGDAGLQLALGGDEWRRLILRDPSGRTLLDIDAGGRLDGFGLTDFFFESNEPPFDEVPFAQFRERFPEGRYTLSGTTVAGRRIVGSDRLTHDVPARPRVLAPTDGARLDRTSVEVRWEPVTRPRGIAIVRYQVIVTDEDSGRELSMDLGRAATSAAIPAGFLEGGREYAVEVIARERSGNQTITQVSFRTAR